MKKDEERHRKTGEERRRHCKGGYYEREGTKVNTGCKVETRQLFASCQDVTVTIPRPELRD